MRWIITKNLDFVLVKMAQKPWGDLLALSNYLYGQLIVVNLAQVSG